MTFASPELLLVLLLVPLALALYLLVQRRRAKYVVRFTNVDLLSNLVPRAPRWRRHVPTALYLGAIAALAIALARPSAVLNVPREEATVMLAMDVSRSMLATDVDPDRITAARAAAESFVEQLPAGFRVGLVAFSTDARLVVAPTTDRAAITDAIENLQADGGTALGDAIVVSLQATADARTTAADTTPGSSPAPSPSAAPADPAQAPLVATVLLSDGSNSTGSTEPLDAASQAAAANMPVYTIALGTQDGTVDVQDPQTGETRTLDVPPDTETLAAIAEETSGRFFEAPSSEDLAQIYESLGSKVGYTQQEQEVTQWFA
ncbi:MAG TPA: VWA domain-containing protein, partial [Candidatus Limnocylindrales bacterium]